MTSDFEQIFNLGDSHLCYVLCVMCCVMTTNFEQIFNLDDRILVFFLYDKPDEDTVSLSVSVNRKGKPMP